MAKSRTKYIGTGATVTLVGLLVWFALSYHFDLELDGDLICAGTYEEPCEPHYNITLTNPVLKYYYIYNKDRVSLGFVPDVKASYNCKKDGRYKSKERLDREKYPCGVGWREFDWKTPLTSKYSYIEKFTRNKKNEYKVVIFKNHPNDKIKWGGNLLKEEIDPILYGQYNVSKICDWIPELQSVFRTYDYEYTCATGDYKINQSIKQAWCYETTVHPNSTPTTEIIFSGGYDRLIPPDTIGWTTTNKTKEYIDVCDIQGYQINQCKLNLTECNIRYCEIVSKNVTCYGNRDGNSYVGYNFEKKKWFKKIDSVDYSGLISCITKLRDCVVKV